MKFYNLICFLIINSKKPSSLLIYLYFSVLFFFQVELLQRAILADSNWVIMSRNLRYSEIVSSVSFVCSAVLLQSAGGLANVYRKLSVWRFKSRQYIVIMDRTQKVEIQWQLILNLGNKLRIVLFHTSICRHSITHTRAYLCTRIQLSRLCCATFCEACSEFYKELHCCYSCWVRLALFLSLLSHSFSYPGCLTTSISFYLFL